jgi:hypothetical protein
MKTLKVICAATVLALFLSIPVYAGDTNPGNVHEPGKASCVCEISCDQIDAESKELTTTGDSDFSLSAVVNMLWTIF